MKTHPPAEGPLRTPSEREAAAAYAEAFARCLDPLETKLTHFTKYVRRQDLTRLLSRYEIFKRVLPMKGSVVECGVFRGSGLMAWANFSAVLEPSNLTRRIYGFDTFGGFASVGERDLNTMRNPTPGDLGADSYDELQDLIRIYDANRFLGHIGKVELIKGDVIETIPRFLKDHPHLVVSLLFLDLDLYDPTRVAIENFYPRIPRGGVIAFDELDNPMWPGETAAVLETLGLNRLRLERYPWDPYVSFAVLE